MTDSGNACQHARKELADLKTILYRDVLAQIDDVSGEIRSLELGRASVNVDDVEDDLTRLTVKFESMTERVKRARESWITATRIE